MFYYRKYILNLLPCVLRSKILGRCPKDGGFNLIIRNYYETFLNPSPPETIVSGGEGLEYTRKITHDQVQTVHVVLSDTHKSMINIQIKDNSMSSTAKAYNSCKPHSTETM